MTSSGFCESSWFVKVGGMWKLNVLLVMLSWSGLQSGHKSRCEASANGYLVWCMIMASHKACQGLKSRKKAFPGRAHHRCRCFQSMNDQI